MTFSWCVVHDSGWQDDGCFAAEVAEHGDPTDCQMVEMELHPAGMIEVVPYWQGLADLDGPPTGYRRIVAKEWEVVE